VKSVGFGQYESAQEFAEAYSIYHNFVRSHTGLPNNITLTQASDIKIHKVDCGEHKKLAGHDHEWFYAPTYQNVKIMARLLSKKWITSRSNYTAYALQFLDFPVLLHNCNTPLTDTPKHKPVQTILYFQILLQVIP